MIERFFIGAFGKLMIALVLILLATTAFNCYEKKTAQQALITAQQEIALVRADNQNLANQLENAQLQITQYQAQVKALHQNVLDKMQQAEQRTNEIMHELEQNKGWANQPVPANVGKLFNERKNSEKTDRSFMPNGSIVPDTKTKH